MSHKKMAWSVLAVVLALVLYAPLHLSALPASTNGEVTIPDVWISEMKPYRDSSVLVRCLSSDNSAELQWYSIDITEGTPPVPAPIAIDGSLQVDLNEDLSATNLIDYYCTATNSFGTARTVPFRVYSHSFIMPIVDNVQVVLGQIAVLSCNLNMTRFFPKPVVRWYIKIMDGSTFIEEFRINPESSSKYKTIDDGRHLVVYNISENDSFSYNHTKDGVTKPIASKIYACTAGYDRLNVPNIEYYIYPRYNLEIEDSLPGEYYSYLTPKNKVILSNETSLSYSFYYIAVSSNDILNVVNYPSNLNSASSTAISVTYNGLPSEVLDKLSVTLALERDSGVINGSEVIANITIIDPLVILPTTPSGVINVLVGESVTFNCTASGTDVRVTWYQNASEIPSYNGSLFTIHNATPADSLVYQCIWYSVAQNVYNKSTWALVVNLQKESTETSVVAIVISLVITGVLLLVVFCLAVIFIKRARKCHQKTRVNRVIHDYRVFFRADISLHVRPEYLPHLSSVIVLNHDLRLLDSIGRGEFGVVYKAHMFSSKSRSDKTLVAVKTLNGIFSDEEVDELMEESLQMKSFQHPNVMNLLGVCLDAGPAPYLILPYMANGNLLSYLKNNRESFILTENCAMNTEVVSSVRIKLISMCLQVAKGMEYLAIQKLVHRDLAARNCMIDETGIIKVADFGLSKSVYDQLYFRQDANDSVKLPIKWLAVESIEDGVFSEKTDVWAFGVTCWEIFSGGKVPYGGLSPLSIPKLLKNGERMEKPDNVACSEYVYKTLMEQCWHGDPDMRPTFSQLHNEISFTLTNMAGYMEFSTISLTITADTAV